mmetsp:Transcript_31049/g.104549  ORF Transcript_31049/g.104549 Transcript_31049/m.104549 type:complete len:454 (-) Transcript_31049:1033-2394(-)
MPAAKARATRHDSDASARASTTTFCGASSSIESSAASCKSVSKSSVWARCACRNCGTDAAMTSSVCVAASLRSNDVVTQPDCRASSAFGSARCSTGRARVRRVANNVSRRANICRARCDPVRDRAAVTAAVAAASTNAPNGCGRCAANARAKTSAAFAAVNAAGLSEPDKARATNGASSDKRSSANAVALPSPARPASMSRVECSRSCNTLTAVSRKARDGCCSSRSTKATKAASRSSTTDASLTARCSASAKSSHRSTEARVSASSWQSASLSRSDAADSSSAATAPTRCITSDAAASANARASAASAATSETENLGPWSPNKRVSRPNAWPSSDAPDARFFFFFGSSSASSMSGTSDAKNKARPACARATMESSCLAAGNFASKPSAKRSARPSRAGRRRHVDRQTSATAATPRASGSPSSSRPAAAAVIVDASAAKVATYTASSRAPSSP